MKTLLYLVFAFLFTSCTAAYKSSNSDFAYSESSQGAYQMRSSVSVDEDYDFKNGDLYEDKNKAEETIERKIIYSAFLTLEVDSSQNAKNQILEMTKEYKGFMISSHTNSITVRIPSADLENALNRFKSVGELVSESQSGQDITDEYFDVQLRLDNAEKARKRYIELLEKAETVEEILKVEVELERLNEKIELYKGKMKNFNNQVDYSKITVRFRAKAEKTKLGPVGFVFVNLYKGVKWLFVRG